MATVRLVISGMKRPRQRRLNMHDVMLTNTKTSEPRAAEMEGKLEVLQVVESVSRVHVSFLDIPPGAGYFWAWRVCVGAWVSIQKAWSTRAVIAKAHFNQSGSDRAQSRTGRTFDSPIICKAALPAPVCHSRGQTQHRSLRAHSNPSRPKQAAHRLPSALTPTKSSTPFNLQQKPSPPLIPPLQDQQHSPLLENAHIPLHTPPHTERWLKHAEWRTVSAATHPNLLKSRPDSKARPVDQALPGSGALSNVSTPPNHQNFNDTANRRKPGSMTHRELMDVALYLELWDRVVYDIHSLWRNFDEARGLATIPDRLHDGRRWVGLLEWFFADIIPLLQPSAPAKKTMSSSSLQLRTWATVFTHFVGPGARCRGTEKKFIQGRPQLDLFQAGQRRCALGFTLCGPIMRVFRFNRSGAKGSTAIDIDEHPHTFLAATTFSSLRTPKRLDSILQSDGTPTTPKLRSCTIPRCIQSCPHFLIRLLSQLRKSTVSVGISLSVDERVVKPLPHKRQLHAAAKSHQDPSDHEPSWIGLAVFPFLQSPSSRTEGCSPRPPLHVHGPQRCASRRVAQPYPQKKAPAVAPYGFLVDFDFAFDQAQQRMSGADVIAGTFPYMSIDVLEGMTKAHSAIQDLESFYYVLLDIVINYDERCAQRNPQPSETIFTSLSFSDNVHELRMFSPSSKNYFLNQTRFINRVVPTFNNKAQSTLWPVIDDWCELIAKIGSRTDHMQ
ncbi:hypothetical protein FN846DRAFT_885720 [Sphaerosporella brunnea]|uniref:Fungal-type protein kinase domain-containing protein n=1 Tax=Sphaerosporella brunnea TaxID=1250544 RepID=A0A5J5FBF8_9PEZI|nr:hypothetical protein FN846DRAFT_885720 [Sphaerosporella brunnea]